MISFDLDHAHPAYRRSLTRILTDLAEKYPRAPLKRVELFEAKPGDRSLGSTEDGGVIRFSSFWFCRDPAFLQAAAKKCIEVEADSRPVLWHGTMIAEPLHVATHEFGHVLSQNYRAGLIGRTLHGRLRR